MTEIYGPLILPHEADKIAAVDAMEYDHPSPEIISNIHFEGEKARKLSGVASHKFKPYNAPCNTQFHASKSSGVRPLNQIKFHVIHCTQSDPGTARAIASYFHGANAGGSTQYVNDDYDCFRTLPDHVICWGAPGANYHGLHYEQCGWANWTQFIWSRKHRRTMLRTAWKVARDCKRYGNRVRWLTDDQLRRNEDGITDHATCSRVFGGTHTDPGKGYPRRLFMTFVRASYAVIKVRRIA
jgi:sarcosine oxidase delta subunit